MLEDVIKLGIPGWKVRTAKDIWHQDEVKRLYAVKNDMVLKQYEREIYN